MYKLLALLCLSTFCLGQGQSGQQITYKGPLTVIHTDPVTLTPDNPGIFHYYIDHDGKRDSLGDFTGGPQLGPIQTGTVVEATGTQQNNGSLSRAHIKPPPPPPQISVAGAQATLVLMVNFSDYTLQPYTSAQIASAFSASSNFVLENSYETAWLVPTVVGWLTIPDSITACNIGTIATDAKTAATAAGVNLGSYTHYVYFFPFDNACPFGGASDVGGNPSESWINGTVDPHVLNHELGHAFGLWHAHLFDCGSTSTICSSPNIVEYGDLIDVMGKPQTASPDYSAFQHELLGWLNLGTLPSIQTITTSGVYTLKPIENGTGPNALKILKGTDSTGAKVYYYLEQRQAVGFDSFLSDSFYTSGTQNETTGILFHLGTAGDSNSDDLLDMSPSTNAQFFFDSALQVNQTYTDSAAGVSITPLSVTSTTSSVQVNFGNTQSGTLSCSAHPLAASYTSGDTSSIDIHVTNNLGNVVSGASVTQTLTKTNGASAHQSCSSNSGGDAVCVYKIKGNDPLGTWSAAESVSQGTLSTSCNTTFLVN